MGKFAKRYDNDPPIAFLQTGFGLWAEYRVVALSDSAVLLGRRLHQRLIEAENCGASSGSIGNTMLAS